VIDEDDFSEGSEIYLRRSNQKDGAGNRMVANSESNGRFHSDWLSMMYPRLKLARNLLREDGAIFISIDDNEIANLRKICDEIFGEKNFVGQFLWKRRASSAMADKNISADHDYVVCYQKGSLDGFTGIEKNFKKYSNPDNDPRGPWIAGDLTVGMTASMRPNQAYDLTDLKTGNIYQVNPNRVWAYIPTSMAKMIDEGRVIFPKNPSKRPMQKRFQNELKGLHNPFSTLMLEKVGLNTEATHTMQEIMGGNIFDYSKPVSLLKVLIPQICNDSDLIVDFFSGSCVTAHALLSLNAEEGSNRKFLMVQLPEACDIKSEAFKAGYKTIAEIGKERIRRAGKKIKIDNADKEGIDQLDIGFRVLKIDSSNMKDVHYTPNEVKQADLIHQVDNIREDRTEEDLLFQILLDWGVDLSLPIIQETIAGKIVFFVDGTALAACFELGLNEAFVKQLAARHPERVVFRDAGFDSDSMKLNVKQIFKLLSPATEVKVI